MEKEQYKRQANSLRINTGKSRIKGIKRRKIKATILVGNGIVSSNTL